MKEFDSEEAPGFWRRNWLPLGLTLALVGGAALFGYQAFTHAGSAAPKTERFVALTLPPPPPAPPPPPPPKVQAPPPPEQHEMVQQTPVNEPEPKPEAKPEPKAPDEPPAIGSNIKGEGNDGFGLSGNGGVGLGSGRGRGGSGGSKYGWYAGQLQTRIQQALRDHPRTRTIKMRLEVRIWPDSSGRITRAQLVGSTGDSSLDSVLQNEVLTGLRLPEPPPAGMPLPIVMRLTASRP